MSTSGTLSQDERWGVSQTLTGNVTVPSPYDLILWEDATINIGSYYIKSTGGSITEQSDVSVSPRIMVKNGATIKGYYPSLASAFSNASSGETVYMKSSQTLSADLSVPSGVTLEISNGTLTMNGKKITSDDGDIIINGGSVSPNIQVKTVSGIYGL